MHRTSWAAILLSREPACYWVHLVKSKLNAFSQPLEGWNQSHAPHNNQTMNLGTTGILNTGVLPLLRLQPASQQDARMQLATAPQVGAQGLSSHLQARKRTQAHSSNQPTTIQELSINPLLSNHIKAYQAIKVGPCEFFVLSGSNKNQSTKKPQRYKKLCSHFISRIYFPNHKYS